MNELLFINKVKEEFYRAETDNQHRYPTSVDDNIPNIIKIDSRNIGCMAIHRDNHMIPGVVELAYLYIYKQNLGYGTTVLKRLCEFADCYKVELVLEAIPQKANIDTISKSKLREWYSGHGFKVSDVSGSDLMSRLPNS